MSIVIDDSFRIKASPDATFALMSDIERVCPCIPGAELLEVRADGSYEIRVGMKIGPMTMSYLGSVRIDETDPVARHARLRARAKEQRGSGTAEATMTMRVDERDGGTSLVTVRSEMLVTGRVAQMGRGIINDVAGRMITDMATAVEQTLEVREAPPAEPDTAREPAPVAQDDPSPAPPVAAQPPVAPQASVTARPPRAGRLIWLVIVGRLRRIRRRMRPRPRR